MFRIVKTEKRKIRANWVTRMLLNLSPMLYDKVETLALARKNLGILAENINEGKYCRYGFSLDLSSDTLSIKSFNKESYIKFKIKAC